MAEILVKLEYLYNISCVNSVLGARGSTGSSPSNNGNPSGGSGSSSSSSGGPSSGGHSGGSGSSSSSNGGPTSGGSGSSAGGGSDGGPGGDTGGENGGGGPGGGGGGSDGGPGGDTGETGGGGPGGGGVPSSRKKRQSPRADPSGLEGSQSVSSGVGIAGPSEGPGDPSDEFSFSPPDAPTQEELGDLAVNDLLEFGSLYAFFSETNRYKNKECYIFLKIKQNVP